MLDDGAIDFDQIKGRPGEDVLISGETGDEFLLILRSQVFAYDDRLLGRCRIKGNCLRSVVALQLCLFMLVGGWAGRLGDFALRRKAVYVPFTGTKSLSMLRAVCWFPYTVITPYGPRIDRKSVV